MDPENEPIRGLWVSTHPGDDRVRSFILLMGLAASHSFYSATSVERWSLVNAVGMLAASMGALWVESPVPIFGAGVVLLGGLVVVARNQWTPQGRFGAANAVTAVRVGLLGGLPLAASAGPGPVIGLGGVILATDAVDGWLARRSNASSEFGAFFDKETDSLFLLLLCALVGFEGRVTLWIMGIGMLRYGFVAVLFLIPTPQKTEPQFPGARFIYGGMIVSLLLSFLPFPALYRPLVGLTAAAILASFVASFWQTAIRPNVFGR